MLKRKPKRDIFRNETVKLMHSLQIVFENPVKYATLFHKLYTYICTSYMYVKISSVSCFVSLILFRCLTIGMYIYICACMCVKSMRTCNMCPIEVHHYDNKVRITTPNNFLNFFLISFALCVSLSLSLLYRRYKTLHLHQGNTFYRICNKY